MAWWIWLNIVLTALVVILAAAWLWAERYERREQEAARRRREQRLVAWQHVELPEPPETYPEPGTTRLDEDLVARLLDSDEFEQLRHFFGAYFHQDMDLEYDDEDDLVRAYVDGHARWPDDVVQLLHAMDKLLALGLSDKELVEASDVLGADFAYGDTNAWLRTMRAMVLAEAKGNLAVTEFETPPDPSIRIDDEGRHSAGLNSDTREPR